MCPVQVSSIVSSVCWWPLTCSEVRYGWRCCTTYSLRGAASAARPVRTVRPVRTSPSLPVRIYDPHSYAWSTFPIHMTLAIVIVYLFLCSVYCPIRPKSKGGEHAGPLLHSALVRSSPIRLVDETSTSSPRRCGFIFLPQSTSINSSVTRPRKQLTAPTAGWLAATRPLPCHSFCLVRAGLGLVLVWSRSFPAGSILHRTISYPSLLPSPLPRSPALLCRRLSLSPSRPWEKGYLPVAALPR